MVCDAFGRADEADLVEQLRDGGHVLLELVADAGGRIVGHILFSPLAASDTRRFAALAPLSAASDMQGRGVGSALMRASLAEARAAGIEAVIVLGDPAYYQRFGFSHEAAGSIASVYSASPAFMALAVREGALTAPATVEYAPPFRG